LGRAAAKDVTLIQALTENNVVGCTVAFNRQLLVLALPPEHAQPGIHFHDWWLYLVAIAFGKVWCDPLPTTCYRQHGGNYMGYGAGVSRYIKMLAYLWRQNWLGSLSAQVGAFRNCYWNALRSAQLSDLDALHVPGRGLRRWHLVLSSTRLRSSWGGELLLRLLLAFDWRSTR